MKKRSALIVTNKRSPDFHVSTVVPRPIGEAFEDVACAYGITRAELLRRLVLALVEIMKRGRSRSASPLRSMEPKFRADVHCLGKPKRRTQWVEVFCFG